ncbi:hypothetical protein EZV62_003634 [Acer yangbiense]|uniref:Uncharacterized protein n=1 Tax=Acer yangbiense TaxID=1000413 RepID=A0A5C7II01_9ROSI|nr:hypothetical protein EZV62_003634 [Acer yangbiense]
MLDRLLSETASEDKSLDLFSLMIVVREPGDSAPYVIEYRHVSHTSYEGCSKAKISEGARSKCTNCIIFMFIFCLSIPELVQRVEKDLVNIMTGATIENADILTCYKFNFRIVI